MTITKRIRYEVLRRDDYTCRYCGGQAPDVVLTYGERDEGDDPDECEVCGGQRCAPGQARAAALVEGYDHGCQEEWTHWYGSFERLQLHALVRVVDRIDRYGRAH